VGYACCILRLVHKVGMQWREPLRRARPRL
jgi:hypothetical protein